MTKKMLIKVTVDEALFPELYQRLDEFQNPRLRATVLRLLANDAVRLTATGAPEASAFSLVPVQRPKENPLSTKKPATSTTPITSREIVAADEQPGADAAKPDAISQLSHRFNVDEIADQFSGF